MVLGRMRVVPHSLSIDCPHTALVVVDLQKGIVGRTTAPYPAAAVVAQAARLATVCRAQGVRVVLVTVAFTDDGGDRLDLPCDMKPATTAAPIKEWATIVPELGPAPGDLCVVKRQWGAFYGTDLDLQLRRRGITTLILCGIATNLGVDTTARNASERGYAQIFASDALSALSAAEHEYSISTILPRLGYVRTTQEIISAIETYGSMNTGE